MSDQGYTYLAQGCVSCGIWQDDKRIHPAFVDRGGYWCCPMCNGSFGSVERTPPDEAITQLESTTTRLEGVTKRLDAMRTPPDEATSRDAERYRWLRENGRCDSKNKGGVSLGSRIQATVAFRFWCEPELLDVALDAAMKEQPK